MRVTSETKLQSVKEKEGDFFAREQLDYKKWQHVGQKLEAVSQCQMSRKMLEANRL